MEANSVDKLLMITESTCACFDDFDSAVDAFRRAVAHSEDECVKDSP